MNNGDAVFFSAHIHAILSRIHTSLSLNAAVAQAVIPGRKLFPPIYIQLVG